MSLMQVIGLFFINCSKHMEDDDSLNEDQRIEKIKQARVNYQKTMQGYYSRYLNLVANAPDDVGLSLLENKDKTLWVVEAEGCADGVEECGISRELFNVSSTVDGGVKKTVQAFTTVTGEKLRDGKIDVLLSPPGVAARARRASEPFYLACMPAAGVCVAYNPASDEYSIVEGGEAFFDSENGFVVSVLDDEGKATPAKVLKCPQLGSLEGCCGEGELFPACKATRRHKDKFPSWGWWLLGGMAGGILVVGGAGWVVKRFTKGGYQNLGSSSTLVSDFVLN